METESQTLRLCMAGIDAEFKRQLDEARALYKEAWSASVNDYDACVAAHYVGHLEEDPHEALRWHLESLARAQRTEDARVDAFYPSLYVNLGQAYERVGNEGEARRFYALASQLGLMHHGLNNTDQL